MKVARDLEVELDARDLNMFLSDNWHAYRILRDGGQIISADGKIYAIDTRSFFRRDPIFEWKRNLP